jgi:hypothetical protein
MKNLHYKYLSKYPVLRREYIHYFMGLKASFWVTPGQRCVKVAGMSRGDPRGVGPSCHSSMEWNFSGDILVCEESVKTGKLDFDM